MAVFGVSRRAAVSVLALAALVGCTLGVARAVATTTPVGSKFYPPRTCMHVGFNARTDGLTAQSGPYTLHLDGDLEGTPTAVYCDFSVAGGGWTVIASYSGSDGEQQVTKDSSVGVVTGDGEGYFVRDAAAKAAVVGGVDAGETLFYRFADQVYLRVDQPLFGSEYPSQTTPVSKSATVYAGNLAGDAEVSASASIGYLVDDELTSAGGELYVSTDSAVPTQNGPNNGLFNNGCASQYVASYSTSTDYDTSLVAGASLGPWTTTSCDATDGGLAMWIGLRCIDSDGDMVCDEDDRCDGDDATGDSDGDGTCDGGAIDTCDPATTLCGCGEVELDEDGNGVCDAYDNARTCAHLQHEKMKRHGIVPPNGVYDLVVQGPVGDLPANVYCDFTTDGGRWTVFHGVEGADGDLSMVTDSDVGTIGSGGTGSYTRSRAIKSSIVSNAVGETLIYLTGGANADEWLIAELELFDSRIAGSPATFTDIGPTSVRTTDGSTMDNVYLSWSTEDANSIVNGGDVAITVGQISSFVNPTAKLLMSGCSNHLLYSLSASAADGDASYKSSVSVGGWPTNGASCVSDEASGSDMAFYVGMRCKDTDSDGVCDEDDACEGDDLTGDSDADGVCDDTDACPGSSDSVAARCGCGFADEDTNFNGVCDVYENARHCAEYQYEYERRSGSTPTNGIFWLKPDGSNAVQLYCDFTTDGGRWTVFGSYTGASGEALLTADTAFSSPQADGTGYWSRSRSTKTLLSASGGDTLFYAWGGANAGSWLSFSKAIFNANLPGSTSISGTVRAPTSDGSVASSAARLGWSTETAATATGSDIGLLVGSSSFESDTLPRHSTCSNHLLYGYATAADEAGYDSCTALGTWGSTSSANAFHTGDGGALQFYVGVRCYDSDGDGLCDEDDLCFGDNSILDVDNDGTCGHVCSAGTDLFRYIHELDLALVSRCITDAPQNHNCDAPDFVFDGTPFWTFVGDPNGAGVAKCEDAAVE